MPFTPCHMGPGMLVKAVLGGSFSLMVFGWTQIVTDLEPLVAMLRGAGRLHGYSHTYLGALFIALFSAATGKYAVEKAVRFVDHPLLKTVSISWWVAILSGFVGSFSHVALDSIMHADVTPFAPFSTASPLHGLISWRGIHEWCVYTGILGVLLYGALRLAGSSRNRSAKAQ